MGHAVISLIPYNKDAHLFVGFGLTDKEVVDKFSASGDLYYRPPTTLAQIKTRVSSKERVKKLLLEWPMDERTGGVVNFEDELYEENGWVIMRFPDEVYFEEMTKPEILKFCITLSHEVLHVCQLFLPKFLDRDSELEAETYFHDYLMGAIIEAIIEKEQN